MKGCSELESRFFEAESLTSCVYSYTTEVPAQTVVLVIPQACQRRRVAFQMSLIDINPNNLTP